ncbi:MULTISPECIES: phosphatidylcholine/phosphatidylserine synthase [Bosea]|uniref:CDP-alcohol phosphatidyltransferase family protein n=1 Tax=Bosea TaxID=85413 RepID=UPI00214FA81F|nr:MULTISPECIES: phosphatidylcholine/phosphatidylserine synthase [Bosea]MCR4522609.1 phosphatidylcholine/phosphatidylserine synthase [Bosea sp. 47.2.35]MDR6827116.1 CDP-diacylglycerol--serine O-phosphatidyltransferase [Bosea robiniae]MDR6893826.1 CDP-diacylglycerol--serine O-phosphatidyltransferase [Bosea sp. BE109]MDR7136474.1 CDP-diacylglycerol--serine O-phosphatidyltransferase [Bosea sp. BE168]MDR7173173.1 CDP-diacylglycerol--serine O-phosphatidyltransferase [Bosea sp. BE271]
MSDLFPPFEPERAESKRARFKPIPFRLLAPNVITLLALCLGLTAMRLVVEGKLETATICILIAAALDGVDGRLARMLKGTSRFGAELDSLSDFVNFGVATGYVLWIFVLHDLKSFGWIIVLTLACAMALRLARFNVMIDDPDRPDWQKDFFVGMPAPAGAITAMLPVYLHMIGVPVQEYGALPVGIYILFIAFLTISRIPCYAGKTLGTRVPRNQVLPIFVAVVIVAGLLFAYTFEVLAVVVIAYLALIPVSVARYRKLERAHAQQAPVPATETAPESQI